MDVRDIDLTLRPPLDNQLEGELRDGTSGFNVSHGRNLILFSFCFDFKVFAKLSK